jgi:DNA-binding protein HU-beta
MIRSLWLCALVSKAFPWTDPVFMAKKRHAGRVDYQLSLTFLWGFPVNKQELVTAVAEKADLPKIKAQAAVEAIFDSIKLTLKEGGEVRLVGFGTFTVAARAATTGRNPRTGDKINIPASKQPKFKAGKELKDAVNV